MDEKVPEVHDARSGFHDIKEPPRFEAPAGYSHWVWIIGPLIVLILASLLWRQMSKRRRREAVKPALSPAEMLRSYIDELMVKDGNFSKSEVGGFYDRLLAFAHQLVQVDDRQFTVQELFEQLRTEEDDGNSSYLLLSSLKKAESLAYQAEEQLDSDQLKPIVAEASQALEVWKQEQCASEVNPRK